MKFTTMNCPECGEPADGILETCQGRALITEPDADGHVQYAGETKFFWEDQGPVMSGMHYTLLCHDGHQWTSDCEGPMCDSCKEEVEEIHRTRQDGVQQCFACYQAEEGPQT